MNKKELEIEKKLVDMEREISRYLSKINTEHIHYGITEHMLGLTQYYSALCAKYIEYKKEVEKE